MRRQHRDAEEGELPPGAHGGGSRGYYEDHYGPGGRERKRPRYHPARLEHRLPIQNGLPMALPPRFQQQTQPPRYYEKPSRFSNGPMPRFEASQQMSRFSHPNRFSSEPQKSTHSERRRHFEQDDERPYQVPQLPRPPARGFSLPMRTPRPPPRNGFSSTRPLYPRSMPPPRGFSNFSSSSSQQQQQQQRLTDRRYTERRQSADDLLLPPPPAESRRKNLIDFTSQEKTSDKVLKPLQTDDTTEVPSVPPYTKTAEVPSVPPYTTEKLTEKKAEPKEVKVPVPHQVAPLPQVLPATNGLKSRLGWGQGLGHEEEARVKEEPAVKEEEEVVVVVKEVAVPKRIAPVAVALAAHRAASDAAILAKQSAQAAVQRYESMKANLAIDRAMAAQVTHNATRAECKDYNDLSNALISIEESIREIEDVLAPKREHAFSLKTPIPKEWSRALLEQKVHSISFNTHPIVGKIPAQADRNVVAEYTLRAIKRLRGIDNDEKTTTTASLRWENLEAGLIAPARTLRRRPSQTYEVSSRGGLALSSVVRKAQIEQGRVEKLPVCAPADIEFQQPEKQDQTEKKAQKSHFEYFWTDIEKLIFLDKFLLYPKNFVRIASYLYNKRARDCVRFYYDTKYLVDYKAVLREHQQRRRGKAAWQSTTLAVRAFGGDLYFESTQNAISFALPESDSAISPFPQRSKDYPAQHRASSLPHDYFNNNNNTKNSNGSLPPHHQQEHNTSSSSFSSAAAKVILQSPAPATRPQSPPTARPASRHQNDNSLPASPAGVS